MEYVSEGNDFHTPQTAKGGYAEEFHKKMGFVVDHTISWFVKSF